MNKHNHIYDIIILGAGPSGTTLYYALSSSPLLDVLIIDKDDIATLKIGEESACADITSITRNKHNLTYTLHTDKLGETFTCRALIMAIGDHGCQNFASIFEVDFDKYLVTDTSGKLGLSGAYAVGSCTLNRPQDDTEIVLNVIHSAYEYINHLRVDGTPED